MRATPEGTLRFAQRQPESRRANYRQSVDGLWLSPIGFGTYLGDPDDTTDAAYEAAFAEALALGCNVFDCAINYRFQRSERSLGRWLAQTLAEGKAQRDEIIIATKGGFVPYDGEMPSDPRDWVARHFLENGLVNPIEFAARYQHCFAPAFLEQMIEWSLDNLGVDTIDIYYLHNPETQSIALSHHTFRARMLDALETLELAVENGQIACYGTATWTGYRVLTNDPAYLSLTEIVGMAVEVAGDDHHLRYVQMPYNLFMTEAYAFENQQLDEQFMSAIQVATDLGLTVMISAPLMQGRLAHPLMPELEEVITGLETDAQRALQFVRSSPGVTTALVGMKDLAHVRENLVLNSIAPVPGEIIRSMYSSGRG
jgi:aryl-alcohol dehydrogenase-like predicted oxidoreductase